MDYEKTYKNALKRARVAYKDEDRHLKATLERIFPEIQESEDEGIRKELIEYFRWNTWNTQILNNFDNRDVIAWLEKQGEQKPKWSDEDEEMIDKIIDYIQPMPIFFESTKGKSGKEYTKEFVKNATKLLKSLKKRREE